MWLYNLEAERSMRKNFSIGAGFMRWTNLMPSDPDSPFGVTEKEWRPQLFVKHKKNDLGKKFSLQQRVKLEHRIRENTGSDPKSGAPTIEDGHYSYERLRLRAQLNYYLNDKGSDVPLYLTLSEEYMIHWGDAQLPALFDQNRLALYFSAQFNEQYEFKLGYLDWYQRRAPVNTYVQRSTLVLNITQKF